MFVSAMNVTTMKPSLWSLRRATLALALFGLSVQGAGAGAADLRITEVRPVTGEVEVTNAGTNSFSTASSLPFCHRFNYASGIPTGTTFAPGESKVFTVSGLNATDSDLWLYRDSAFASASSILTGLKYGPAASAGRVSVAVAAGIWPANNAAVPAPGIGESLQPFSIEATRTTNWFSGAANFGSFSPVRIEISSITRSGSNLVLEFSSPLPLVTHRLETRRAFAPAFPWTESLATISNLAPSIFQLRIPQSTNTSEFVRIKAIPQ